MECGNLKRLVGQYLKEDVSTIREDKKKKKDSPSGLKEGKIFWMTSPNNIRRGGAL